MNYLDELTTQERVDVFVCDTLYPLTYNEVGAYFRSIWPVGKLTSKHLDSIADLVLSTAHTLYEYLPSYKQLLLNSPVVSSTVELLPEKLLFQALMYSCELWCANDIAGDNQPDGSYK